jgi:HEAT repeat protein
MLPIRFARLRRFCGASLIGLILLLWLGRAAHGPVRAGPLPSISVDDFKALIDPKRTEYINPEPAAAAETLADYHRKLRRAAADLPSLGQVARVLLLTDWPSAEFEFGEKVPPDQVRKALENSQSEAFKRDVAKLMAAYPDDPDRVTRALASEIKSEVRLQLLDRLEKRTRFYLSQGRLADRIAAANLITDTLATSRHQDISQWRDPITKTLIPSEVMRKKPEDIQDSTQSSSHNLRERLRGLSGDVEKLLADPNSQVRVAAIRALSDLEKTPGHLVAILKPLLASPQTDATTRRAAAEALGHSLEAYTTAMVKDRPQPYLTAVEKVLQAAADTLSDSDALVRRAGLESCQRAALVLEELAHDPLAPSDRRPVFAPTLSVVDKVLPKLNAAARDRVPELRVGACHVLETLALAVQKFGYYKGTPLPPRPDLPQERRRLKKKTSLPSSRSSVQTAAFLAPPPDELPPPLPVDPGLQDTVQAMIANLKHPDYRVRLAAVDTLETFGGQAEAAIPALVSALRDFNKFVRWGSARTLGRLHPRQADLVVPGLMGMLDDREDPSVRIAAASALELYGEHARKAVPTLARVINRGDKEYIVAILHAIQGIGTDAAPTLPNVAWVLGDRSQPPSVRIEAAQTLGRFGPLAKDQLSVLRDVMNNEADEDIRNAASIAVLAIDRPEK